MNPTGLTKSQVEAKIKQGKAYSSDYTDFRKALSAPLSGYYIRGSALSQGGYGFFWSSTWYSTNSMRRLGMNTSGVTPSSDDGRHYGFSVRCIKD